MFFTASKHNTWINLRNNSTNLLAVVCVSIVSSGLVSMVYQRDSGPSHYNSCTYVDNLCKIAETNKTYHKISMCHYTL